MQIINNREKIGKALFTTGLIIELMVMVAEHSSFVEIPFVGRLTHVAFFLFCLKILMTRYTKFQYVMILFGGILGAVSYITCNDEYVIRAAVFIFASREIELKKLVEVVLYTMLIGTLVIIGTACVGIAGDMKMVADFGRGGIETRYIMGFSHANNLHDMLWYLLALLVLCKHEKIDWKGYVFLSVLNIVLFMFTVSRNGMIATQLLVIACAMIKYIPILKEIMLPYILGGIGLILCLWMTWLGGKYGAVNSSLTAFLDRFLTNRLEMIWEFAPISSWKIFPEARELFYVDNGFATLFFHYGYVVGVIYVVMLLFMLYCLYKRKDGVGLCVLVTAIFVTFIETTFIFNTSLLCNVVLVVMMDRWYCNKEE